MHLFISRKLISPILLFCALSYSLPGAPAAAFTKPSQSRPDRDMLLKLTLEQAVARALEANRVMLSSQYIVRNDELSLKLSHSFFDVKMIPTGSLGAYGGDTDERTYGLGVAFQKMFSYGTKTGVGPRINKSGDFYSSEVDFKIEQPLLRGFGKDVNLDGIRSAEFTLRNSKRSLYQVRVTTVLDTVSAVYEVVKQAELVKLNSGMAERVRGHAESAKVKEKSGLATGMNVYRAEIRLKDFENNLSLAREAFQDAQDKLKTILALPLELELDVTAPVSAETVIVGLDEAVDTALKKRVDYIRVLDELSEAKRRADIANHNILPGLNLQFTYTRYGSDDSFGSSTHLNNDRWNLMLFSTTSLPMTAEKTAYLQSLNAIETIRLRLDTKQDEIKREVRRQLTALKKLEERITLRKEQIIQAEGKLALASVKFVHDLADNFDIIEAETELQQARVNLLSAGIDYIIGTYNLRAILGTLIVYEDEMPES